MTKESKWQRRLLVSFSKQLFILMKEDTMSVLVIVDSILMQEIESVSKVGVDEVHLQKLRLFSVISLAYKTFRIFHDLRIRL